MNVYDTERMTESLQTEGYVPTDSVEDADMILLNTCHIREKAAEKVYSELGRFKNLKSENPDLKNRGCWMRCPSRGRRNHSKAAIS